MNGFLIPFLLIAGVFSLYMGAELLVRGAVSLASRVGLPALVIALTIVGCGTGAPELIVSVQSSLEGKGDIALGNVIGSNIANIGLVLGLSAILRPIHVRPQIFRYDAPIMIGVCVALFCMFLVRAQIDRWEGWGLLVGFVLYVAYTLHHGKKGRVNEKELVQELAPYRIRNLGLELGALGLAFAFLFLGARLLLEGAVNLATSFGISEAVIGLTIVAVGTSLPELATSAVAAFKNEHDIALGNVVGSNIFNTLAVVGVASIVQPIETVGIRWPEYAYMIIQAMLLWVLMWFGSRISRWQGFLLLVLYFGYIGYLFSSL